MGINKNKLKQDIFLSLDILDSLVPMRFVTAVAEQDKEGDLLERVSRELWKRMWCTHQDITQPASLIEVSYSQPKIKKLNQINKKNSLVQCNYSIPVVLKPVLDQEPCTFFLCLPISDTPISCSLY